MLELITKDNGFDEVYAIMDESFPETEYRPYEEQKALFCDPAYKIYVKRGENGATVGFLAAWDFDEVLFIEHFAVSLKKRNGGVGSDMLRELAEMTKKPMCLEVEPPEDDLTKRRVAFYERNGFVLNHYPYIQPSVSKGRPSVPLLIMTYGRAIEEVEYLGMKKVVYERVYKCVSDL